MPRYSTSSSHNLGRPHPVTPLAYPGYVIRALAGTDVAKDLRDDPQAYDQVLGLVCESMRSANTGFAWLLFTSKADPTPAEFNLVRARGANLFLSKTEFLAPVPRPAHGYIVSPRYETPSGKAFDIVTVLPNVSALEIPPNLRPLLAVELAPLAETPFYTN